MIIASVIASVIASPHISAGMSLLLSQQSKMGLNLLSYRY